MFREFNVTGICVPELHYMVHISQKIDKIMELVEPGKYFTINRPRQYGKTTTLQSLYKSIINFNKKVVLMIDEVNRSCNNHLFLIF